MIKNNPIEILVDDHKKLKTVMKKITKNIEANDKDIFSELFNKFKELFNSHDKTEDNIVYPALMEYESLNKLILKGYQAHHMVEVGILELKITPYLAETWGPKFLVIQDCILTHMEEEETLLFPKALKVLSKKKLYSIGDEIVSSRE